MKLALITPVFVFALSLVGGFTSSSVAQESRWGSPDEETVKFMRTAEGKWASSACSFQPDLKDVIADDFQGHPQKDSATVRPRLSPQRPSHWPATANSAR